MRPRLMLLGGAAVAALTLSAYTLRASLDALEGGPTVAIGVLGRFEVCIDGRFVPPSEWRSRKARDVLRFLVARRGRPVPRSEVAELLWPDDDPALTAHRLSVLLSLIRTVTAREVLLADAGSIALDLTQVRVDVTAYLDDIARATRTRDRALLAAAELSYVGDPFEDDPYADWAVPVREEARAAHLGALRLLAELAREDGDAQLAAAYLRRLLEADPYDEDAHRALVAVFVDAGGHGEARRTFARYAAAMADIGVEPPDPALLSPTRPLRLTAS